MGVAPVKFQTFPLDMDVYPQACLSDSRQASIHCSNGIPHPHWCRSTLVDKVGNSHTFNRAM